MASDVAGQTLIKSTIALGSTSELLDTLEEHSNVVSWINDVLEVSENPSDGERSSALTELDRRVTNLLGTLEIASEETSVKVDRLIEDISRGASRLTYDLHFMRESALSLHGVLHNVEAKSNSSLGSETDAALDRLHFLDTVKHNLETTREVLREAESWSTLESDVTSLLGEKNYEKAAERLSEASKSMVVFENTQEYESRRTLMVSLQNQLEASLSSALVAAVNSQDVVVCRNYFFIFANIQRESEFRNYYYGSRRGPLVEEWQKVQLRDCDPGSSIEPSSVTFSSFLPAFYTSFQNVLQTERTSIPAIFPDPRPTLSALITSTLFALQPSFSQRLEALSTHYGNTALTQLIAVYRVTEDFAVATDKILEKVSYAAPMTSGDEPPTGRLRRRSSTRMSMSMSRRVGSHRASISGVGMLAPPTLDWDEELFEPFVDFQVVYTVLESRLLEDTLTVAFAAESRARVDHARLLRERAVDIFGVAEEAITRCMAFTHGYGALGLIQSVDHLFAAFTDKSNAELRSRRSGQSGQPLTTSALGEDLSDLDYTADDWADIQALLHFLEAVRTLLDRMVVFESKLRTSLVQVSTSLRQARNDTAGILMSGANRGKFQLLMRSSLNSAELQDILNKVDPEPSQQLSRGDAFLAPTPPTPDARRSPHFNVSHPSFAPAPPLLLSARSAISELAKTCQQSLEDTILSPLYNYLASYSSSSHWSTPGDPKAKRPVTGGRALSEASVPTFSLSPSNTMQHVAEGLLNLPRLFEVYADDDALAFSLETLPYISEDLLRGLAEPAAPAESTLSSSGRPHTRRSPSLSLKASPALSLSATAPVPPPALAPEAVSAAWLSSLGLSLVSHLTSEVLPRIGKLTPAGAAQLASDLGYLSNIVMALNVESAELEKWREWVDVDDFDGRQKLKDARDALAPGEREEAVTITVARLRGWV